MAHCPYEQLQDLDGVLEEIRRLPKLKESKPGIFYYKGQSFLHFHLKDGRRWADARDKEGWGSEMDIPFQATKTIKTRFLNEVKRRFEAQSADS